MLELNSRLTRMEVRCDRCKTECKVESTSAIGPGTAVQCRDCGHFIVIGSPLPPADPGQAASGASTTDDVEWLVETVHGRSLRAPDLATLHRWIIERRVTREDRISRDGKLWERIGEVADLVPFFDIVDSAERARRADTPAPIPRPSPPMAVAAAPVAPARGALPEVEDHTETKIVDTARSRFQLPVKLALMTLVAALVAYAGIALHNLRSRPQEIVPTPVASPKAEGQSAPTPALPVVEPVAEPEEAEPRARATAPTPGGEGGGGRSIAHKRSRAAARALAGRGNRGTAAGAARRSTASAIPAAAPQNLAAQGYAALNRRQFPQAIDHFKQALVGNPSNGTALFGLAEAYRESGQKALALKCYRRYVQLLPSGPDAGQSRLQIRLLEKNMR